MMKYAKMAMLKFKPKQIKFEEKIMHDLVKFSKLPSDQAVKPDQRKKFEKLIEELKVKVV